MERTASKPTRRKRPAKEESDDAEEYADSSAGDESEIEEAEIGMIADEGDEEIDADVGFYDPGEEDVEFVEKLIALAGTASYGGIDTSQLTKEICKQTRVGTVVRIGEEVEDIAFISALSSSTHHALLRPLRKLLVRSAVNEEAQKLKAIFPKEGESSKMGLLVTERVVNFPPELVPKLHEAIFDEISWAQEDEPTKELQESFKFESYLYLTSGMTNSTGLSTKLKARKKSKRKRRKKKGQNPVDEAPAKLEFFRYEDDIIYNNSSLVLSFSLPGQAPVKGGLVLRRFAIFFPATAVAKIREEITKGIGNGS
mmetsp:Transcript_29485/g.114043  ORF Transcript_29485/g.114043 Transcript_29485/m.114043 type:complete len:312 (-) Transcript_29485:1022-1957(-)